MSLTKILMVRKAEVFTSDNNNDKIEIHPDDVLLVKSADNYVNIVYREGEKIRQKMLRNTLNQIQAQLRRYPEFLRCHRTSIINSLSHRKPDQQLQGIQTATS